MSDIITAIDVGTTKICTFIAESTPEGRLRLLGAGCTRSEGLRKGVVVNVSAATQAITESIEQAEQMAGVTVHNAFVGIVGGHIKSQNGIGTVTSPAGAASNAAISTGFWTQLRRSPSPPTVRLSTPSPETSLSTSKRALANRSGCTAIVWK